MPQKKIIIIVAAVIILLGIVGGVFLSNRKQPEEEVVATTTPKVEKVELLPQDALAVSIKKGSYPLYTLTIAKIPDDSSTISYEITYDTKNKGSQGIVGSPVSLKDGQTTYTNDKIVFGSESRGHYSLDEGVNNIQISVRIGLKDGSEKGWKGTLEI